MHKTFFIFFLLVFTSSSFAQYREAIKEIETAPKDFSGVSVLLRMIEGAGFRYYWATEGLTSKDVKAKPCDECRSSFETLSHVYSLSEVIRSTVYNKVFIKPSDINNLGDFAGIIAATNANWAEVANYLRQNKPGVDSMEINFGQSRKASFWNLLNGPLADTIYHTGQLVSMRRVSGNPINPKVNVFKGVLNK